jgi:hypothetical protein
MAFWLYQPYNIYYNFQNLKIERVAPLSFIECTLDVPGWLARCWLGAMLLHHTPLL